MSQDHYDVAVLGSGCAGSILASIARRAGLSVVLVERWRHPRFAIGESSTPLANMKLQQLAQAYDLPWLASLSKYGVWKRTHPDIGCGLKRGFSFFHHQAGSAFEPSADHRNELLVAANPDEERGDTHWFRADFDAYLVTQAAAIGVDYLDECIIESIEHDGRWRLHGTRGSSTIGFSASFIVDASGPSGALAKVLGQTATTEGVRTATRSIYGHFRGVKRWTDVLVDTGGEVTDYPFSSDASALHHVVDGGWMWVLRFDNGITSAGFSLDMKRHPLDEAVSPELEWQNLLMRYPSIGRQFASASVVGKLVRTGRLQRRWPAVVGADWAMTPHAACFLDPWLSPGLALTLFGVQRLGRILAKHWSSSDREERLVDYSQTLFREVGVMDRITSACFECFDRFDVVVATAMLYFAAVTYGEERIRASLSLPNESFLLANDPRFTAAVADLCDEAIAVDASGAGAFAKRVAAAVEPYNSVGLCDPSRRNLYPYITNTATSVRSTP